MQSKDKFVRYYETRDIELRNQIVEENLYIVEILIKKYLNKGVEYDDLYQVASLALISAVERFDPGKGFEFTSFATPTILGEIKKYFRDKVWSVKVPRRTKEILGKIQKEKQLFYKSNKRYPTVEEISEITGFSSEEVQNAMESSQVYGTFSLDKDMGDEEGNQTDPLAKYISINEKGYDEIEYKELVDKVYRSLSGANKYIFRKRFIENISQKVIAEELGVSQMTISRAEKKIKEKIRQEFLA